ncbi:hypothetical protein K4E47_000689 [Escherichia coli]|nr:hypothetical protein [Escherichia coli]
MTVQVARKDLCEVRI